MGTRQEGTEHHGSNLLCAAVVLDRRKNGGSERSKPPWGSVNMVWKSSCQSAAFFLSCRWAGWLHFNTIPFYHMSSAPAANLLTMPSPQVAWPKQCKVFSEMRTVLRWNSMLSGDYLPHERYTCIDPDSSLDDVSMKLKSQYHENRNRSNNITRNVELHQVMLWRWNEMNDDLISMI